MLDKTEDIEEKERLVSDIKSALQELNSQDFKEMFISQFDQLVDKTLNSSVRVLNLRRFVFPPFEEQEWAKLWFRLGGNEEGGNVDLKSNGLTINAEGSIFTGIAIFTRWNFADHASFEEALFLGNITRFDGAYFGDSTSFNSAWFDSEETSFNNSHFGKHTDFTGAVFSKNIRELDFTSVYFEDDASFSMAEFYAEKVSFNNARFGQQTSFDDVHFGRSVKQLDFTAASFENNTLFFNIDFDAEHISFNSARMGDQVSFIEARFSENVKELDFAGATFGDGIVFEGTIFDAKEVIFNFAVINGSFMLEPERVRGRLEMQRLQFGSDGHIVINDPRTMNRILWNDTFFIQDHPRIFLQKSDNRQSGWDEWPPRPGQKNWERRLQKLINLWNIEEAERIYRQVRLTMEYNGRFSDAGEVHGVEMYLRTRRFLTGSSRVNRWLNRILKLGFDWRKAYRLNLPAILETLIKFPAALAVSILLLILMPAVVISSILIAPFMRRIHTFNGITHLYYGIMSGWGEKVGTPIVFLLIFSLLGASLAWISPDGQPFDYFKEVFHTMTLFPYKSQITLVNESLDPLLRWYFRFYGILLIALFVLALRRKFSRGGAP